jgi:hypothetical protein
MSTLAPKTCSISGCPRDKAYAIIRNNRIHRITFSKSLADYIVSQMDESYQIHRITFTIGKKLEPQQKSSTGLYAIVSKKTDWTLRITMFQEIAETFRDDSRYIAECFIEEEL